MSRKVIITAYACEPGKGSEIGVGWNWVKLIADNYDETFVITRAANKATINDSSLELSGVNFIYHDLPRWATFWKKGVRGIYLYYFLWIKMSQNKVNRVINQNQISTSFHLTYGNALLPIIKTRNIRTRIAGPIGGLECIDDEFVEYFRFTERLKESIKKRFIYSKIGQYILFQKFRDYDLIICKTLDTKKALPAKLKAKVVVETDVALPEIEKNQSAFSSTESNILAVGRLQGWRGFDLLIEAYYQASLLKNVGFLTIIGYGKDEKRLKKLINKFNLHNKVCILNNVGMRKYLLCLQNADLIVNPTLKEGGVTVAFDSIALDKKLICIESGGYTRTIKNSDAIILKAESRKDVIEKLKNTLLSVERNEPRISRDYKSELNWNGKRDIVRDILKELC